MNGSTTMSQQLTIPTADTQLYTVDTPGGAPPLLFLNGGFGTLQNWDRVVQRLAGKYRTVRFLYGHHPLHPGGERLSSATP